MSTEKWPFLPDRLTRVLPEDLVRFIQSGSAVRLGMATAIVELGTGPDGRPTFSHISTDDPFLNFTSFCTYLRGAEASGLRFVGGEQACLAFDGQTALQFINGEIKCDPGHVGASYKCHMGLRDYAAPIKVAGRDVALLLTGQRRPEDPDQVAAIRSKVDAIGREGSRVQVACGDKDKLKRLVDEIPLPVDDPLGRLEKEADWIAGFANEKWRLQKREHEEEFIRSLRVCDTAHEALLDADLERLLREAAEWCGVMWAALFVSERPGGSLLTKVLRSGLELAASGVWPHFNWRKAGLPDVEQGTVEEALDIRAIEKGIRGYNAPLWFGSVGFAYAVSLATGHRAMFCFGRRPDGLGLIGESDFLGRLAHQICHPYLERRQFLELKSREMEWEDATSLIGHEVRGSLQPIQAEADIVRKRVIEGETLISQERVEQALDAITGQCKALADVATEALDFWRWTVGKNHREFKRRPLAQIVRSSVEELRGFALREYIEIRVDPSVDKLPEVEVIGQTLEVALRNILENAIKYSFDRKYIEVRPRVEHGFVTLEIENFGIGIPEEERARVFEKGYRGPYRGRMTERRGMGLGAWQAREIARAHGGDIECASYAGERHPRPGDVHGFKTVFRLRLPIDQTGRFDGTE